VIRLVGRYLRAAGDVFVRCRREPNGQAGMQLGIALEDAAWPAMGETLQRVILEAGRVHA
jgi:hypothetical protein